MFYLFFHKKARLNKKYLEIKILKLFIIYIHYLQILLTKASIVRLNFFSLSSLKKIRKDL